MDDVLEVVSSSIGTKSFSFKAGISMALKLLITKA